MVRLASQSVKPFFCNNCVTAMDSALKTQSWQNLANRRVCHVCIDAHRRHRIMKLDLPSVQNYS
jgi:hypothetical protein